jgi:hypothetical protein
MEQRAVGLRERDARGLIHHSEQNTHKYYKNVIRTYMLYVHPEGNSFHKSIKLTFQQEPIHQSIFKGAKTIRHTRPPGRHSIWKHKLILPMLTKYMWAPQDGPEFVAEANCKSFQ